MPPQSTYTPAQLAALPEETYLLEAEVAGYLRITPQLLRQWRSAQKGPRFHKLGGQVRYLLGEVRAWARGETVPMLEPTRGQGQFPTLMERLRKAWGK